MRVGVLLVCLLSGGCHFFDQTPPPEVSIRFSEDVPALADTLPLLTLAEEAPAPERLTAPRWAAVALNVSLMRPLSEEDLLIFPESSSPVLPGMCQFFTSSEKLLPSRKVRFFSADGSQAARRYFYLRRGDSTQPLGLGLLDERGEASCSFPEGFWIVSVGQGFLRREQAVVKSEVSLPLVPRGTLLLTSGEADGAFAGDVVRISRLKPFSELSLDFDMSPFFMRDLFRSLLSREENFGARESLVTSFLVGNIPLSLQLEAGNYLVSLFRKTEVSPCLARVTVASEQEVRLSCPLGSSPSALGAQRDEESFPALFQSSAAFQSFLRVRRLAGESVGAKREIPLGNSFPGGRFSGFSAEGVRDPAAHCELLTQAMNRGELPLVSSGAESLAKGATPFVTGWRTLGGNGGLEQNQISYFVLGNGTFVRPLSYGTGVLISVPPQHRFRFRMEIPLGNPTDVVALLLNGKEWHRYTVARGNVELPAALEMEETIIRKEDFHFTVCAWGNRFNAEFLQGLGAVTPFALSRSVCVDADDDGRCSAR